MIDKSYIKQGIARIFGLVCYCFGFLFGAVIVRFGMGKYMRNRYNRDVEIEEMVRIMNEQGPNN